MAGRGLLPFTAKVGHSQEPPFRRVLGGLLSEMAIPEGLGTEIAVAAKAERSFRITNVF